MIRKGLTLVGSWHYNLADFAKLMQVIESSYHLDTLITHRFPMSRIQTAFDTTLTRRSGKIILDPWL